MNINGMYKKVWKVEVLEKLVKVDIGDSKKNKDGTYTNWTWFNVAFVGGAKDLASTLTKGDTIEIVNGMVTQDKSEKDGKYYTNMVVFDFNITQKAEGSNEVEYEDSLPY